jgi:hypothetical protein
VDRYGDTRGGCEACKQGVGVDWARGAGGTSAQGLGGSQMYDTATPGQMYPRRWSMHICPDPKPAEEAEESFLLGPVDHY